MQFVRSSSAVLSNTLRKCAIAVSGASVPRNVGQKCRSFTNFGENSKSIHLFSPNKFFPNQLPNHQFHKDCTRKETTLKKLQKHGYAKYYFSTDSSNDKDKAKALVWVSKGYDDGKGPKGAPEEDDGDLSDYMPKRRRFGWFARRRQRQEEEEKKYGKQETDRNHARQQQPQRRWWFFGRQTVPKGLELLSYGTWESVFDPISSIPKIRLMVMGTVIFIIVFEFIGYGFEYGLEVFIRRSEKLLDDPNVHPEEKEARLYLLSFVPYVAPMVPLTFLQSKFFPLLNKLIYSEDASQHWFAIRSAYAATSHDEIRIWAELFPVEKAIEIIAKSYDSIMETNSTLVKIPGIYIKQEPTEMEYYHAMYKMTQQMPVKPLSFEDLHRLVDGIEESATFREEEGKKMEDAAFFFQNFTQYSSLLEEFSTEPAIHMLAKFCRTRISDLPESYLIQLLSMQIMEKVDLLETLKDHNKLRNATILDLQEDSSGKPKAAPIDPMEDTLQREIDEIVMRTNKAIMHCENASQSLLRLRNLAVMSFANMARSPEVRKRLLQEAIPYQLIRIRESTSDPELKTACEEALGNILNHDQKDTEYFQYLHKQLKEPIRFSRTDENRKEVSTVIKMKDEDLAQLALAATEKNKHKPGGLFMRSWEIGITFAFGYFYAKTRWRVFLRFFQRLKHKRLRKHIMNFRSPHAALMSALMIFQFDRVFKSHWFGDEYLLTEVARYVNQFIIFNFFVFSIALAPYCIVPSIVGTVAVGAIMSPITDHFVDDMKLSGHVRHMKHMKERDLDEPANVKDAIEWMFRYVKSLVM